ncbi:MAG TPA: biotin/lipoyl-binding protein, partial [Gammaproteobacteria bacterium]|nr:biotin/lipoyl-binding protein [Gammaproteobacteria bacterium]
MKNKKRLILLLLAVLAVGGGLWWWLHRAPAAPANQLTLYGNVDIRQVELAFNGSERIAAIKVQEGDRVHKGQSLASLDPTRLGDTVDRAAAQLHAQQAVVAKL